MDRDPGGDAFSTPGLRGHVHRQGFSTLNLVARVAERVHLKGFVGLAGQKDKFLRGVGEVDIFGCCTILQGDQNGLGKGRGGVEGDPKLGHLSFGDRVDDGGERKGGWAGASLERFAREDASR